MPQAREGDTCNHRADAFQSVQVTSNYMANLGRNAPRQRAFDKGLFRIQARGFLHIGEYRHLTSICAVALPPKVVPGCSSGGHEVMHDGKRLVKDPVLSMRYPVTHIHVILMIRVEAADLLQGGASC